MKCEYVVNFVNIFIDKDKLGCLWGWQLYKKYSGIRRNCSKRQISLFPHMTILQQMTLNIFFQKIENLSNWMDNLWLKAENIVAKGQIARFEQFLHLSLGFLKAICCRGVSKGLYEGKGKFNDSSIIYRVPIFFLDASKVVCCIN